MNNLKTSICTLIACCTATWALEVIPAQDSLTLRTKTLEAIVQNGTIVGLKDRRDGTVWARQQLKDTGDIPQGLGVMTDLPNLKRGHIPWGEPTLNQHLPLGFPLLNNYRPADGTPCTVTRKGNQVTATWNTLTNGKTQLNQATFSLTFDEDDQGALLITVGGNHTDNKVFGAEITLANLDNQARVLVPGFGGIAYDGDGTPGLMPFGSAPFIEIPLLMAQKNGRSLALWKEDTTLRPFYAFVRRSGTSMAMAFESLNLMPFENKNACQSPVFKLNVFKGDWKTAATPYRNWYQKTYAQEIARRDSIAWANDIRTILDVYMVVPDDKTLARIAEQMDPKRVLFQIWNARAANFDQDLPDWTPRERYVDGVRRLHQFGFKAMAYVNTYCANYQSPVWKRDRLSEFFLTRKNSIYTYKGQSQADTSQAINEKLIGTVDYAVKGENQFKNIPEKRLLYGDPLAKAWRTYHANMMKTWNTTTGTDANYEDTAGTSGDFGNGIVDGLSAAQGSVEAMRLLQTTQPKVAMASEYGPESIAFAIHWALNYAGHWGYDDFKRYRIHHQYPIASYIFGHRQWVSSMMGDRNLVCHAEAAVSDATGGLGLAMTGHPLTLPEEKARQNFTFQRHFTERAIAFVKHQLKPVFPQHDYPVNVRCYYQGTEGLYAYCDDGVLQEMKAPDGRALYGRAYGGNKVKTRLWLPNWPMQNGTEIFGLDPDKFYPLFVKPEDAPATAIAIDSLPDKVYAVDYQEVNGTALLILDALPGGPKKISFTFSHEPRLNAFTVNGKKLHGNRVTATLPLRLAAMTAPKAVPVGHPLATLSDRPTRNVLGKLLYSQNSGSSAFPCHVTSPQDALEICLQNTHDKHPWHGHDGTIVRVLINGREIARHDSLLPGTKKGAFTPDTKLHAWMIPLGSYAGQDVLVTVQTDMKKNTNWDRQFISVPRLIRDSRQKLVFKTFGDAFEVVKHVGSPDGWWGDAMKDVTATQKSPRPVLLMDKAGFRMSKQQFPVDPSRTYRLSGMFKATQPGKGWLCFGLFPRTADGKQIHPDTVNTIRKTFTRLAKPARKGDTILTLESTEHWKNEKQFFVVAFEAKSDFSDLPNFQRVGMERIEGKQVFLKAPLTRDYPAGTAVRQHRSGSTYSYSGANYKTVPTETWQEFSGMISGESLFGLEPSMLWHGTRKVHVILLSTQPNIMVKDLTLDEIRMKEE